MDLLTLFLGKGRNRIVVFVGPGYVNRCHLWGPSEGDVDITTSFPCQLAVFRVLAVVGLDLFFVPYGYNCP